MRSEKTIYALSSGGLPSGLAVIRLSGPRAIEVAEVLAGLTLSERELIFCQFRSASGEDVLDRGLVTIFREPRSFTGEDAAELHLHGGRAIVARVLEELNGFDDLELAEPGEFSRRAFENGKLDLTSAEGLADLIGAETELQRKLALRQSGGGFRRKLEEWRGKLIRARAYIEAEFDFSDEEDVPDSLHEEVVVQVEELLTEVEEQLADAAVGELIRDGYQVAILGPPNAGKSSLLNALAKRDVAIVSAVPGTTRDIVEVTLNIQGVPVVLKDTAGVRDTVDEIESLGISRSKQAAREADIVIWLSGNGSGPDKKDIEVPVVVVRSKADLPGNGSAGHDLEISTFGEPGVEALLALLIERVNRSVSDSGDILVSRGRQKQGLNTLASHLSAFVSDPSDLVLASERLRLAGDDIGRLTGRIDVEDLLDVVFSEFCVGK